MGEAEGAVVCGLFGLAVVVVVAVGGAGGTVAVGDEVVVCVVAVGYGALRDGLLRVELVWGVVFLFDELTAGGVITILGGVPVGVGVGKGGASQVVGLYGDATFALAPAEPCHSALDLAGPAKPVVVAADTGVFVDMILIVHVVLGKCPINQY